MYSSHTWFGSYLSGDTAGKSDLLASVVWIRREAMKRVNCQYAFDIVYLGNVEHSPVNTNCPTVAEKPERKALKGYPPIISTSVPNHPQPLPPMPKLAYIVSSQNAIKELQGTDDGQKSHK